LHVPGAPAADAGRRPAAGRAAAPARPWPAGVAGPGPRLSPRCPGPPPRPGSPLLVSAGGLHPVGGAHWGGNGYGPGPEGVRGRGRVGGSGTVSERGAYRPETFRSRLGVPEGAPEILSLEAFSVSQVWTVSWSAWPLASLYSAAAPATCGLAIEVPLSESVPPPGTVDSMSTPGA